MGEKRATILLLLVFYSFLISTQEIDTATANPYYPIPPSLPSIFIRSDGTIDPSTAPIQQVGNVYIFKNNIANYTINVQCDNVTVDGAGYTLQGYGIGIGVNLTDRKGVTIRNIEITKVRIGILLTRSSNNTISDNTVIGNEEGILLSSSFNNTFRDNVIANNRWNFEVSARQLSYFVNDIDTSNTVDEKPIYYWVNMHNRVLPSDAGYIALINCTNILVQNSNLTNNKHDVLLVHTESSTITNNTFLNAEQGIKIFSSNFNRIVRNNVVNCSYGISCFEAQYTNIEFNNLTGFRYGVSLQNSSKNQLTGNNFFRGSHGIYVFTSNNNSIVNNNLTKLYTGILVQSSHYNSIIGNNVTDNNGKGIWLHYYCKNNNIFHNLIKGNHYGLKFYGVEVINNTISGNNILTNDYGVTIDTDSQTLFSYGTIIENNLFYHNNFIGNDIHIHTWGDPIWERNIWDNGFLSGGNYWSYYTFIREDIFNGKFQNITGSDGFGDRKNNSDGYPLVAPIKIFDAGIWEWKNYYISIISNSTVSDFSFNPDPIDSIQFKVEGEEVTTGFCRVIIPKDLLYTEGDWIVLVDGISIAPKVNEDTSNTYLYFTYSHSTKNVEIIGTTAIPEFPSWIILPLLIVATLVGVIIRNKIIKKGLE